MTAGKALCLYAVAALAALAGCGEAERREQPAAERPALQFERASAEPVRHGERLARVLGCRGCHRDDLTGDSWIDEPRLAILFTSNLSREVPRYTDEQLARAIRQGVRHDGSQLWTMPSELFTHIAASDMSALIAWLRTVPPTGPERPRIVIGPEGRRGIAAGELRTTPEEVRRARAVGSPALDGRHEWARYIIRATCSECHGLDLRGRREEEGPRGPPDLVVAGAYTRDQFRRLMRTGRPPDGRDLGLMARVARGRYAYFTDREVDAIHDYLAARAAAAR
jgi:cytochrome c553